MALISFILGFGTIVYAFGERDYRLKGVEKDINKMGEKYAQKTNEYEEKLRHFDDRLDRANEFRLRADQRLAIMEENLLGEETASRLRGMPPAPTNNDRHWKSDNSGIEL